jgi:hypothetical protein
MLPSFGWPVIPVPLLSRFAKAAFFSALAFTFYSAVIPPQEALQLVPWDKAEHFIAFYTLTGLAAAAFPRRHVILIAALLSAFGALIEIVQGLPMVHRDKDVWDWVADTLAVGAALAPMLLVGWRRVASGGTWVAAPGVAAPDQKNIDM